MDLLMLFGGLFILMLLGLPITFSMAASAIFFLLVSGQMDMLLMLPNRMVLGCESYGLMAIPFFFFAGAIMSTAGLTHRLIDFSRVIVGHITGSLALINVLASMFFSGISGSCVSDTSAIGSVLIPAMKKDGYSPEFSAAVTGASSTIGHIIPPSIPMILIGVMQEMPIGKLFSGRSDPGLVARVIPPGGFIRHKQKTELSQGRATSGFPHDVQSVNRRFFCPDHAADRGLAVLSWVIVTVTETGVLACIYGIALGYLL